MQMTHRNCQQYSVGLLVFGILRDACLFIAVLKLTMWRLACLCLLSTETKAMHGSYTFISEEAFHVFQTSLQPATG